MSRQLNWAQLWWVNYDQDSKVLTVQFNRVGRYEYANVPGDIGHDLMTKPQEVAAETFCKKVEGTYKSKRIGD